LGNTISSVVPQVIPELYIQVTPELQIESIGTDYVYEWPNLYTGVGPLMNGVITPYIGDTVNGTMVREASRYHATDTELTFSVSGYSIPTGVQLIECYWDFGDNNFAVGNPVSHIYTTSNPTTKVSVQCSFSNGQVVTNNKAIGLYRAFPLEYTNLVVDPSFEHDTPGGSAYNWFTGGLNGVATGPATITVVSGIAYEGNNSMQVTTLSGASAGSASILLGQLPGNATYSVGMYLKGENGGEEVTAIFGGANIVGTYGSGSLTLTTDFQHLTFTATVPTQSDSYGLNIASSLTAAITFYIDAVMVVQGTQLPPFFDGDYPFCTWGGVAGQSISYTLVENEIVQF
jgi:hypothetical protein